MKNERKSRFENYESSTKRSDRKYVNPDGSRMSDLQIAVRKMLAQRKQITTR